MKSENRAAFLKGLRDGIPIALGYFAVAFTLGIAARNAGLNAFQSTLASFLLNASAGEFAGFTLIASGATYFEAAIMEAVANARYLLMSCALSQKFSPDTKPIHRFLVGYDVTDEIFGISVTVPGKLNPFYSYGAIAVAIPGWSIGTCIGTLMGNVLPGRVVSALSVGIFGMFLAIIVPPARKSRIIAGLVAVSMLLSYVFASLSVFSALSSGIKTILLTVVISAAAAILFPVKEEQHEG